jgi:hypothetical protein
MTTELEEALLSAGADLHLGRPAADVIDRGRRLRRNRRMAWSGVAGAVLVVTSGAAVMAAGPSGHPPVAADPTPSATGSASTPPASPSPTSAPSADKDLGSAELICRPTLPGMGVPRDQAPLAGGSRDGLSIVLYHYQDRSAVCTAKRLADGRVEPTGGQATVWHPLLPGQSFRPVALMTAPLSGNRTVDGMAIFLVRADVARLVLHMDGADVDAEVHDGVAVLWLPDDLKTATYAYATATTYDAEGNVLEDRPVPTRPTG